MLPLQEFEKCLQDSEYGSLNLVNLSGFWHQLTVRTATSGQVMAFVKIHPQNLSKVILDYCLWSFFLKVPWNKGWTPWVPANVFATLRDCSSANYNTNMYFNDCRKYCRGKGRELKITFSEGSGASCKITSLLFHLQTDRWKANSSWSGFNENNSWCFLLSEATKSN